MREDEATDLGQCAVCGREIDLEDPIHYAVSITTVVCHECARRHGGQFDPESEKWLRMPTFPSSVTKRFVD
ncbi:MAG TPA: hypothetical protein VK116_05125 [Planctomycetota bacterium]|nr:hypothetical protein [Planctomycetota bacterium]